MTDTATVDEAVAPVIASETAEPIITDELVRSLALKLNPYVKVGRDVPVANLKPQGYLADVVESLGWSEAERTRPFVSAFVAAFPLAVSWAGLRYTTASPADRRPYR